MKGFNNYAFDIIEKAERKIINSSALMLFNLGTRKYKLDYPEEYNKYMRYALRLQMKIDKKIRSLRFRSIRKILRKMMKVHFPERENVEELLRRIKRKNFDIQLV